MRSKTVLLLALAFVAGSIMTGTMASAEKGGVGDNLIVDALNNIAIAISEFDSVVNVDPTPITVNAPQGEKGDTGDTGPAGTSQAGSWVTESSTPSGTTGFVKWDVEKINTDTSVFGFTPEADHIVIKQSGTYLVTASVESENLVAGESGAWRLSKDGESICTVRFSSGSVFPDHTSCTVITTFTAGQKLQLKDFSDTNNIFGLPGGDNTILSVLKLS